MDCDFLRKQARQCLRWAADCFDLQAAERFRLLGEALAGEADRIDREARVQRRDSASYA